MSITLTKSKADSFSPDSIPGLFSQLEGRYTITDEENLFRNLVNPSLSKNQPYYGWARYREAYSGELVKELIKRSNLSNKKHFIYDPMVGSGATLLASTELEFDSLGNDVNPYAVDISNAKLHKYKREDLKIVRDFVENSKIPNAKGVAHFQRMMENCSRYFNANHKATLQKISDQIALIKRTGARKLLDAVWLMILEDCSNRKKDGNGLATRETTVTDVWEHFRTATIKTIQDIEAEPLPENVTTKAVMDSAFNAQKIIDQFSKRTEKRLGAIIFSPPYANSFDYFESYKLELLCGYYTQTEFIEARKSAIRNYRKGYGYDLVSNNKYVNQLCEAIRERIPAKEARTGVTDNRSRLVPNLLVGYFEDMEKTLKAFSDSMPKGSYCYIVVDQSAYLGVVIPTDLILADIADKHGLNVERVIKCRTAKTSAQQLKEYPYLRSVLRESIVVLQK